MSIMAIERLDLLSAIRKIEASVCKHPVHIEDYYTNLPGLFQYVLHRYYAARDLKCFTEIRAASIRLIAFNFLYGNGAALLNDNIQER
jgi:hypothetical protein